MDGHPELLREIQREISEARDGRIPFARFMELALYHERYGYYTGPASVRGGRIGKKGDYFTSVSVGPLFGKLLAIQFVKFREELGNPAEFEVVEFGGHRGQLRADVLAAAPNLRYRIIEKGDPLPDSIVGCVFSNEFLDALPVHLVQVKDGVWQEIYVTLPEIVGQAARLPSTQQRQAGRLPYNDLVETLGPLSTPRLTDYLRDLPVEHMEGYRTEVNLRALDWLTDIARRLKRGWIVTIDYGYERHEYFAPHRREGTLLCYHQHTKSANPYANIGEQDITAHVEFTSLIEHGKKLGLEVVTFTDQAHYLLQIGESEIAEIVGRTAGQLSKERAAIQQLIHPELMGHTFRVLVQRKAS